MKKKWYLYAVISALITPFALADLADTAGNVARKIVEAFNLGWLGVGSDTLVIAFTRMLIWIFMFTVFFAVMVGLKERGTPPFRDLARSHAGIIAAIVATIAAVFLPGTILAATGAGWATAISLFLIGGPVVGLALLLFKYPGKGNDTKATVLLKIILCFVLLWILAAVSHHLGRIGVS